MKFDPLITLGDLIALGGLLLGLLVIWGRFRALETKVDALWQWFVARIRQMNGGNR